MRPFIGSFVVLLLSLLLGFGCAQGTKDEGSVIAQDTTHLRSADTSTMEQDVKQEKVKQKRATVTITEDSLLPFSLFPLQLHGDRLIVPISETYRYSMHPDSGIIDPRYLGVIEVNEQNNYHKLDSIYRQRFFERSSIDATDSLFVYLMETGTVHRFSIADLDVVATMNPYGVYGDIRQYEYILGFDLQHTGWNKGNQYVPGLVTAAEQNPFQENSLAPVRWVPSDTLRTFENLQPSYAKNFISDYRIDSAVRMDWSDRYVVVQVLQHKKYSYQNANQLLGFSGNDSLLINYLIPNGEGSSPAPLNRKGHPHGDDVQWAGPLFKGLPPVIFGLCYYSFGCDIVYFIDDEIQPIRLMCDNRH